MPEERIHPSPGVALVLPGAPPEEIDAPHQLAPTVGQIPAKLWDPVADDVLAFVRDEIWQAQAERSEFESKLARWRLVYDAPMPSGPKRFPFLGASNLTLPVVKEAVNTLAAQIAQSALTVRPPWVLQDMAEEWEPFVDDIERFMDIGAERDLNLEEHATNWIIENAKYGTSIMQVSYEYMESISYRYTSDGKKVYKKNVIKKDGPGLHNMNLHDFLIRFTEQSIQRAQWCSKRVRMNKRSLDTEVANGRFIAAQVEKLLKLRQGDEPEEPDQVQEEIEKTRPVRDRPYIVHEVWTSWTFGRNDAPSEIVLYYSEELEQFLGHQFHPYWHGLRPFVKAGYMPVENRFYDQGLCEMLEQLQEAMSARFNQRSDNITINSLSMFVTRAGTKTLQPGDPLYSGKIIQAVNPAEDILPLRMGEVYPSTFQEEASLRNFGERLSGQGEALAGTAAPVTRTTASAQLALLQEQRNRMGLTISNIRRALNQVGEMTSHLYFQFGTRGKALAWLGERGRTVDMIFSLPSRAVELGTGFRTQVPTSVVNREVKRENALSMFNLTIQLYQQLLPLVQMLAPQEMPNVVREMVRGGQKFLGDVLETFDVSNPEDALAGLAVFERILPRAEDLGGLEAFQRATENAEVLEKLGRLEGVLREAEAIRNGDPGRPVPSRRPERTPATAGRAPSISDGLFFGGPPTGGERN